MYSICMMMNWEPAIHMGQRYRAPAALRGGRVIASMFYRWKPLVVSWTCGKWQLTFETFPKWPCVLYNVVQISQVFLSLTFLLSEYLFTVHVFSRLNPSKSTTGLKQKRCTATISLSLLPFSLPISVSLFLLRRWLINLDSCVSQQRLTAVVR